MRRISPLLAVLLVSACSVSAGTSDSVPAPAPDAGAGGAIVADLRADSNRDGEVRFDESDSVKTVWDATSGAVLLANIDDDKGRCKKVGDDVDLPSCNDATNDVVDGADDALDLARLKTRPWAEAPDTATGTFAVNAPAKEQVRLFWRSGAGATDFEVVTDDTTFTAAELRAGVELAIEAKDIVRDTATWDGFVDVTLTVAVGAETATDTVKMRVAPVLTFHHLLPAEEVFISDTGTPGNRKTRADLATSCAAAGVPEPTLIDERDQWAQDFFETAYMSMPGPGGAQHVMNVDLRSANVYSPGDEQNPLRPAGQVVFTNFRGKDTGAIQQFDARHSQSMDSLNSFGNLETIPPYTLGDKTYPFGRILRGKTASFYPDPTFVKMMEAQAMQPPVYVDTSWLLVGHIDETMSFVKVKSPRGWVLLVNDPTIAKKMLEDQVAAGKGATPMFVGKSWFNDNGKPSPAQATIDAVLADTAVMTASADAATEVDAQLAKVKAETGLTEAEIIRVPFLHTSMQGGSYAYIPGMVNGILVSDTRFVVPDPHGPIIDGADIFKKTMTERLAPLGVKVDFAEDWDDYHAALGEVHCGSNARRKIPAALWWESGR